MDTPSPSTSRPARHASAGRSTLEALPPDLLAAVAAMLGPGPADRLCLAECSRTLLAASRRRSPSWWGELEVELGDEASMQGFQAWLARRRPALRRLHATAMVPELVTLKLEGGGRGFALSRLNSRQLLALCAHTQLTELVFSRCNLAALPPQLGGLTRLQSLAFDDVLELHSGLEHLSSLRHCLTSLRLSVLPNSAPAVLPPALSRLCCLRKAAISDRFCGQEHLPPHLVCPDLSGSELAEVPAAVARMTGLQALNVSKSPIGAGWERLAGLPLTSLNLSTCAIDAVPQAVSRLTLLRRLDISNGLAELAGCVSLPEQHSLRHLSALSRLTFLDLGFIDGPLPPFLTSFTALRRLRFYLLHGSSLVALSTLRQLTSLTAGCTALPSRPSSPS
ncbi:hypothetical protein ABPG75_009114 [Micractinium tetrahymenae]